MRVSLASASYRCWGIPSWVPCISRRGRPTCLPWWFGRCGSVPCRAAPHREGGCARARGRLGSAKIQKQFFSLIIYYLHHNTLQNFAFRRDEKFWFRKFAYENSERWAMSSERWAVSSERWAMSGEQWAVSSECSWSPTTELLTTYCSYINSPHPIAIPPENQKKQREN